MSLAGSIQQAGIVKLKSEITINGKLHRAGDVLPWTSIYPFFLFHMLAFGASGFLMAYVDRGPPVGFLYMHGGIAIFVYMIFYLSIFGREEVKWMLINAGLGVFGIYNEMNWLLSFSGKTLSSYPLYVHVVPFLYYVMYTFLLRQALLDLMGAREDEDKKRSVERYYVGISFLVYAGFNVLKN
jgi:hypothetical protein